MNLSCPQHEPYVSGAITSQGLDALVNAALSDIQASFACNVQYGVPDASLTETRSRLSSSNPDPFFLVIRNPQGASRFIEKNTRAYLLNHKEWMTNIRWTIDQKITGRYLYAPAAILLHSFKESGAVFWCRNTLIHELLHSTSLYSRVWQDPIDLVDKHEALIEGITEFLDGYVLFKKQHNCYVTWQSSTRGKCAISYKERTRLFCSLAQIIGVTPIANFYFSNGSDFNQEWNKFVQSVRSLGFKKFSFSLNKNMAFREDNFREVCVKSIPGFKAIYDSRIKALDYSRVH